MDKHRIPQMQRTRMSAALAVASAWVLLAASAQTAEVEHVNPTITPVSIILDTDMHTDCDDVGTLALLHALADMGEARILAVVHSAPAPWGPRCVEAVNRYYGRPDIPIGAMSWPDYEESPVYDHYRGSHRYLARHDREYVERVGRTIADDPGNPPDAVALYRRVLAGAPDGSVTICAVGMLYAVAELLDSPPDDISPLNGRELVSQKVRQLVTMAGGTFPEGADKFNWECDRPSTGRVVNDWPVGLAVSPHGEHVLTGARLAAETPEGNPVRMAYEIYLQGAGKSRSSWDQIAMLYAVRGTAGLFVQQTGHRITYDPATGRNQWLPDPESPQVCVDLEADVGAVRDAIEDLMVRAPENGPG